MTEPSSLSVDYVVTNPLAIVPSYARPGDAGLDLCSVVEVELAPLMRSLIPTGLRLALPEGTCGLVLPRSGLAVNFGVTTLNAPGLIDSGYRGEVKVVLYNADPKTSFVIEVGMRIAQLLVLGYPEVAFKEVEELSSSERGHGGFGHSGLRST